jgi:hypothetical protein
MDFVAAESKERGIENRVRESNEEMLSSQTIAESNEINIP